MKAKLKVAAVSGAVSLRPGTFVDSQDPCCPLSTNDIKSFINRGLAEEVADNAGKASSSGTRAKRKRTSKGTSAKKNG